MRVWLLCEYKKFCNNIFAIIVLCPQKYYLINTMCLRWQLRWMRQSLRHFYLSKKENVNMRGGMQKGPYKFKGPQTLKLPLSFLMWLSLTTKLTFELYRYCVFHMLNKDFSKLMWTYVFVMLVLTLNSFAFITITVITATTVYVYSKQKCICI